MSAEERRLAVLRAIVEDFVSTQDPVGSKALADRHNLGVSPATIRTDMAALEDEGYITQPHTSAGRVPTDKGYRLFVDRLSAAKPLSPAERKAIQSFLAGAGDLDDVLRRTVRLLAQLTRQVAVVQYPVLTRSSVRHLEVVDLGPRRLMLVLITDTGRVEQRVLEVPDPLAESDVTDLRRVLNGNLSGRKLADAHQALLDLPDLVAAGLRPAMLTIVGELIEALVDQPEERIVTGGTANLTRNAMDFPHSLRPVLEALEEQVVLLRLIGEVDAGTVLVRIGQENEHAGLATASVVSVGYGAGAAALGGLGVVGPTRMDYAGNIGAVRAVARYVGQLLAGN